MKIKYFASGFFLCTHNFSRGIQKSYLEHRAGIRKTRKMKDKKVLTKIKDMMTHLRSGNDVFNYRTPASKKIYTLFSESTSGLRPTSADRRPIIEFDFF